MTQPKSFMRKLVLSLMQSTVFLASEPIKSNSLENSDAAVHVFVKLHAIHCVNLILEQANSFGLFIPFILYTPELSGFVGS